MDWNDALFGRDDWYQQRRIGELREQVRTLQGGIAQQHGVASSAASAIHRLTELHQEQEEEIERLEVALDTLTRVLIEKHGVDDHVRRGLPEVRWRMSEHARGVKALPS